MTARISFQAARRLRSDRRGVLLLVVMALLALLTLLGLTLVMATAQSRLSAKAAARSNPAAMRADAAMKETLYQVLRGTNDPDSVMGAHGLLEDLYGRAALYGYVGVPGAPTPADVVPLAGGQLIQMNIAASSGILAPYNGAYSGQLITMLEGPAQGRTARIVSYTYQVTFATIQVMGFDGLLPKTGNGTNAGDQFVINGRPFSGTGFGFDLTNCPPVPTGTPPVQWNLTQNPPTAYTAPYDIQPAGPGLVYGALLTALEPASLMPYALLPNHAQIQLTASAAPPFYSDRAGPGGANESYDAVDFQNMLLALHVPIGATGTGFTPIPSLLRPELPAWYVANAQSLSGSAGLALRRKVILRPEPMDQVKASWKDLDGNGVFDYREPWMDVNGDGAFTPGTDLYIDLNGDSNYTQGDVDFTGKLFNPVTGPYYISATGAYLPDTPTGVATLQKVDWDVDNDNDGFNDSIWVDLGLPIQELPDGTKYKTMAAILCIDMDGKLNLNAAGTTAQLDPNRYANATAVSPPNDAILNTPTINAPAPGAPTGQIYPLSAISTRTAPIGQGYGTAEINPAYLLSRIASFATPQVDPQTLNYMAYLMMGYSYVEVNTSTTPYTYTFYFSVDGKYGESARYYNPVFTAYQGLYGPAPNTSPVWFPAEPAVGNSFLQYLTSGPRPGWSRWIDPYMTALTYSSPVLNSTGVGWDWVNDPLTLARMSDYRPFLMTPFAQLQSGYSQQGVYFDFVAPNLIPWLGAAAGAPGSAASAAANPAVHLPTAHGSPYDLDGRGVMVTDLRGVPYHAGTAALPWMMGASAAGAVDWALPISATVPPAPSAGNVLYDASINALNDVPDSPYELDLSNVAQHDGRDTGNSAVTTTIDSPFTASELEGILRFKDTDAQGFRTRLDQLQGIYNAEGITNPAGPPPPPTYPLPSKTAPSAQSDLTKLRLSMTTESWDMPAPSIALTPSQMRDVAAFNLKYSVAGPQLVFNNLSVADLARARIFAENIALPIYAPPMSADAALFGNLIDVNYPGIYPTARTVPKQPVWPLLAPEVVMGLRMDLNRLLGNGRDDNGNGVVDDPLEALVGEALQYPASVLNGNALQMTTALLDHNNDGFFPAVDLTGADTRARQLLARQLYVLMMLLIDDRAISVTSLYTGAPFNTITPPLTPQEQAAYVVAQWAINVVDFRDRDSIMTPFEFDLHPFLDDDAALGLATAVDPTGMPYGTWDVDDMLGVNPLTAASDDAQRWRGLVWGCERPELLITEAIAIHDRGTDDTTQAKNVQPSNTPDTLYNQTGATNPDMTFDQVRRPRGSIMVELLNPNSVSDAPQFDMLQNPAGGYLPGNGVNLSQFVLTPGGSGIPTASPVWRLAIAYSSTYDTPTVYPSMPATVPQLDPRGAVQLPPSSIHRVAYFAPLNPVPGQGSAINPNNAVTEIPAGRSFFADMTVPSSLIVAPDSYAIIGNGTADPTSGARSLYFGQRSTANAQKNSYKSSVIYGTPGVYGAAQYADTSGATLQPLGPYNTTMGVNIKPVTGLPIATLSLDSGYNPTAGAPNTTLRFSISEPEYGYPLWPTVGGSNWDDGFYQTPYPNTPFDDPNNTYADFTAAPNPPIKPNPNVAPDGADMISNVEGYTTIYLQRLANPMLPWNALTNPYIVVDSMPLDLTVYTGEWSGGGTTGGIEPAYQGVTTAYTTNGRFDGRQRGSSNDTLTQMGPNVWSSSNTAAASQLTMNTSTLANPLANSTPGYLNQAYWWNPVTNTQPTTWQTAFYSSNNFAALAPLTASCSSLGIPIGQFFGDPLTPFPWFTWLNRPFVSQFELMLVPASSPASMYTDFGMLGWTNPAAGTALAEYQTSMNLLGKLPFAQFEHLLNFYNSPQAATPGAGMTNLYRIFEFVHVPSRFAGTQTMLEPNQFAAGTTIAHSFHPPFNWLSRYREPGKLNLNTVIDMQVFEGVMDDYPGWGTLWQNLLHSRQGFGLQATPTVLNPLPNPFAITAATPFPTNFVNPFRPDGAGAMVPPTAMATPKLSSMMHQWGYPGTATNYYGVNATLLRASGLYADPANAFIDPTNPTTPATKALFDDANFDVNNLTANLKYNSNTTTPFRHAGRNAYFQYQAFQRLGNLATNRSNVYAVWITLSKFEVQETPITAVNPNGYQLVKELGSDTGEVEHQRGFYLIDRSIPVGFDRGANLNVERTLLIERILDQ